MENGELGRRSGREGVRSGECKSDRVGGGEMKSQKNSQVGRGSGQMSLSRTEVEAEKLRVGEGMMSGWVKLGEYE